MEEIANKKESSHYNRELRAMPPLKSSEHARTNIHQETMPACETGKDWHL
jgi:hypothetical protein